jgi:peroxiredoxin Q/BCP
MFERYWVKHGLFPLIGLPDLRRRVVRRYGQEFRPLKFGRLPAQVLVDRSGTVRFAYYGSHWTDIPSIADSLAAIDEVNSGPA